MSPDLNTIIIIIIFIIISILPLFTPLGAILCFNKAKASKKIPSIEFERLMHYGGRGGLITLTWVSLSFGLLAWDSYLFLPSPINPAPLYFPLLYLIMLWPFSSGFTFYLYNYYLNKLRKGTETNHLNQEQQNSDNFPYGALAFLAFTMLLMLIKRI